MLTICDTHALLFWADAPAKLSAAADMAIREGIIKETLSCADISLWEIAMLYHRGRINNQAGVGIQAYIQDIVDAMSIKVLPITPEIAEMSQNEMFPHGDPADRLIAATAIVHGARLVTADNNLLAVRGLHCVW